MSRLARAVFTQQGVSGTIEFIQESPSHPVKTCINLSGLRGKAGGFHVHQLPVPQRTSSTDNPCMRTGGHFNPSNVDASASPPAGEGIYHEYEVGDLSGKYGSLEGLRRRNNCFMDTNLSLFGRNSIINRSVVIHKNPGGDRWVCVNITNYQSMARVARAAFKQHGVSGKIEFSQASPSHPVKTCINLSGLRGNAGGFHVHQLPVPQRTSSTENRCLGTGGHFNPFNFDASVGPPAGVVGDDEYEVGDLSGKYGSLEGMDKRNQCFIDTNLSLFGKNSIVNRSVVIHKNPGGDRWVCVDIELVG